MLRRSRGTCRRRGACLGALPATIGLLLCLQGGPARAAWNPGDLVVDYGVSLSDGERLGVVDAAEGERKFTADLLWPIDPPPCPAQAPGGLDPDGNPGRARGAEPRPVSGPPPH